jgi:polysaccharide biosynthesis/export protein
MHHQIKLIAFLICGMLSQASAVFAADAYRLQQGDAVQVSVWGEEKLLQEVKVLPDGSITFPLAGRVEVVGLSTPDAEAKITEKLKKYLPDPQVTVVVRSTEGNRFYVVGKVAKAGAIPITGPISALQGLSLAGVFDKFAATDEIKILRGEGDHQKVIPLNYGKLVKGQDLSGNIQLMSGDVILVP